MTERGNPREVVCETDIDMYIYLLSVWTDLAVADESPSVVPDDPSGFWRCQYGMNVLLVSCMNSSGPLMGWNSGLEQWAA